VTSVKFQQVPCGNFAYSPTDPIEEAATAGTSGLRCDNGQYIYNWKTDKSQKGKCYLLVLTLNDGSVHLANVSLTQ
jgi:hypothetical protein